MMPGTALRFCQVMTLHPCTLEIGLMKELRDDFAAIPRFGARHHHDPTELWISPAAKTPQQDRDTVIVDTTCARPMRAMAHNLRWANVR